MQWLNPKAWLASVAGMGAFAADGEALQDGLAILSKRDFVRAHDRLIESPVAIKRAESIEITFEDGRVKRAPA